MGRLFTKALSVVFSGILLSTASGYASSSSDMSMGDTMTALNSFVSETSQTPMETYCNIPPYANNKVKPNVVFLMDFSGSMQFPAYYSCDFAGYWPSKVARCAGEKDCSKLHGAEKEACEEKKYIDVTYDPEKIYYGYFDPTKYYVYDENLKAWVVSDSCNVSPEWKNIGEGECISGNLMNFLVTSRIDAALKAMIGGKADCSGDNCILMPQGAVRYVKVHFGNSDAGCKFKIFPEQPKKGDYSDKHLMIMLKGGCDSCGNTCPFTQWKKKRRADVLVSASERHGVVQDNFDKVDMTLMVFAKDSACNSSEDSRYGEVRYSFYENNLSELVDKVQSEVPYCGTPTGEAMWEVEDFLKQKNEHRYESNSEYIARGTYKDPYYMEVDGTLFPVPCKKSYVVLISDGEWNGDVDPVKPAYSMHVNDLRDDIDGIQTADVYTLYAFSSSAEGKNSLETVAAFGSFQDSCENGWPYPFNGFPEDSRKVNWPVTNCDPNYSYNSCCIEWDLDKNGTPDNFFSANNGKELENDLRKVFEKILSSTSGTSVASLAKKNVRGAVLCQSAFYPYKDFNGNRLTWVGNLYTWWFLNTKEVQNIREDTNRNGVLDVTEDYILNWAYDDGRLVISKYSSNSEGKADKKVATYTSFEGLNPVFEAGEKLAYRAYGDRRVYTDVDGKLVPFDVSHLDQFSQYLGSTLPDCLNGDKSNLVNYILGKDIEGCRSRAIDEDGDTWKLGDSTYSSPVVVDYSNYSVVFVGANDGMLHAFRLGYLEKTSDVKHPVKISDAKNDSSRNLLGEELWAFIPKNALPYLRYLADSNYCHLYYVDLTPYVVDVNLNGEERKILIGGMRFGGATGSADSSAVKPPADTCSDSSCTGLSSYFAIDVTDPEKPVFLWEFSSPDLGFSYSGPGIIKKDGKYYVVFASGPVNYKADFSGDSTTLKIFVLDLETGKLVGSIDTGISDAFSGRIFKEGVDLNGDGSTDYLIFGYSRQDGSPDNFKGGLIILANKGSSADKLIPLDDNPADWSAVAIQNLGTDIMPVTSKVELMKSFGRWYLYFGTGRWFYKYDSTEVTNNSLFGVPLLTDTGSYNSFNYAYLSKRLVDVTDSKNAETVCSDASKGIIDGWYIRLEGSDLSRGYLKEKAISDPTTTEDNVIIFTTVQPNGEPCKLGGRSRLWVLNGATGGSVLDNCSVFGISRLYGTVLLQLSGTDIQEIQLRYDRLNGQSNIASVLPQGGNRATVWFTGIAPESAPPFVYPSNALVGTLLLWLEM